MPNPLIWSFGLYSTNCKCTRAGTAQLHLYRTEDINRALLLVASLAPGPKLAHSPGDSGVSFSFSRHWPSIQASLPVPDDSLVQRAGWDEGRAQSSIRALSSAGSPPGLGSIPPPLHPNPLPPQCSLPRHTCFMAVAREGDAKEKS